MSDNQSPVPEDTTQPLPTTPDELLAVFDSLGIDYQLHEHEAVYTVAESSRLDAHIPGTPCRNLFLRDKKKRMYLVVAPNSRGIDLKKLQAVLDSDRLSFASPDRLMQYLGVRPGAVCPFALINDSGHDVTAVLDQGMMAAERVNYHPLDNRMTVGIAPADLRTFIDFCGHRPQIIDLETVAPDA